MGHSSEKYDKLFVTISILGPVSHIAQELTPGLVIFVKEIKSRLLIL